MLWKLLNCSTDRVNFLILNYLFQFLIETIEPFCRNNGIENIVMKEYYRRLLNPMETCSHRYVPKAIYCSLHTSSHDGIDIKKYDLDENNWNNFKTMTFVAMKYSFGSVLVNGELLLLGGYHDHEATVYDHSTGKYVQKYTQTYLNNVSSRDITKKETCSPVLIFHTN